MGGRENFNCSACRKAKGPSGFSERAFEFEKEISVGRESWTLHRHVNFRHLHYYVNRHHCCVNFRQLHHYANCHRYSYGLRHLHRYSSGWVRSRNVTEPDSCGSGRNKFAAPSKSERAADCKSAAAANNHDCCWKV